MAFLTANPDAVVVSEIEDGLGIWEVGGYFQVKPDAVELALLSAAFGARKFTLSELPDSGWQEKVNRELAPVRAGRFVVHGSHWKDVVCCDEVPILIDASLAFGTGHHPTTGGCLEILDRLQHEGCSVRHAADIGTGTGVLAIAMTKIWRCSVLACDSDPTAVATARFNVKKNSAGSNIQCLESKGVGNSSFLEAAPFDLITANILSKPLIQLADSLIGLLKPGGMAILSGITLEQCETVCEAYAEAGADRIKKLHRDGWVTILLKRVC